MTQGNNIAKLIIDAASRNPSGIAIRTTSGVVTYEQLKSTIITFALHLQRHGVTRASCIAIDAARPDAVIALTLAAALLGCSWVQRSSAALKSKAIGITHLIYEGDRKYPKAKNIIKLDESWLAKPAGVTNSQKLSFEGFTSPDAPWMIAQSSGTTGTPKFMAISAAMAWRRVEEPYALLEGEAPIFASLFPLSSIASVRTRLAVFARGGTFVAGRDYEYFAANGVNFVMGSPNQFTELFRRQPQPARPRINVARLLGGSISAAFLQTMLTYFGSVLYVYGSTETSRVCEKIFSGAQAGKISVGRVISTAEIHIVDDAGNDLPAGTEGAVKLRSDGQVAGYIGDPAATAASFRGGWFYPGDFGYISNDGELYITGRVDDVLNIGGSKINAAIIDEIIQTTPGVTDGICFIQPALQGINELAAIISINADFDAAEIAASIRKQLQAKTKRAAVPKRIYVCDKIPRNANGKAVRGDAIKSVSGIDPI